MNTKRILVIGGTGMMGSAIVPLLLEKGYWVDAVSLDKVESNCENLRYIQADLYKDTEMLYKLLENGYDGIIDFLHYPNVDDYKERMPKFLQSTKHYIFLSSYRVYADCKDALTETSPRLTEAYVDDTDLMEGDTYGVSKCRAEDALRASGYNNYTIVRPVVVYAPACLLLNTWKGRLIPYRAQQGKPLLLPIDCKDKGAAIISSQDIARLFMGVLFNEKAFGQAYTFGSPEPCTWGELAKFYEELCGISCQWIDGKAFWEMATDGKDVDGGYRYMLYYDRFFNRSVNVEKVLRDTGISADSFFAHKDGIKKCLETVPENYQRGELDKIQCNYMDKYLALHKEF